MPRGQGATRVLPCQPVTHAIAGATLWRMSSRSRWIPRFTVAASALPLPREPVATVSGYASDGAEMRREMPWPPRAGLEEELTELGYDTWRPIQILAPAVVSTDCTISIGFAPESGPWAPRTFKTRTALGLVR
jgi:hypothetical protein